MDRVTSTWMPRLLPTPFSMFWPSPSSASGFSSPMMLWPSKYLQLSLSDTLAHPSLALPPLKASGPTVCLRTAPFASVTMTRVRKDIFSLALWSHDPLHMILQAATQNGSD